MFAICIRKYFILFNILATLSQHLPRRQPHQQIATIIVSATSVTTAATTTTAAIGTAAAATTTARTTSASAFVDEVLPHNDSVATTTLHAKAIDNSSMAHNKHNDTNDFEQLLERKLQEEAMQAAGAAGASAMPDRLLSRKRRYLIFPEGSSFQLVYDGIYGIVDFTNYLVLGITVALAWELPSKPQGEVIEEIANRLKDGRLEVRRNDTATNLTYADTNGNQTQAMKQQPFQVTKNARPSYIQLLTATSPAARKSDYKYSYRKAGRLPSAAFHAPMHAKYYYYKAGNKYGKSNSKDGKYHMLRRPADSYFKRPQAATPPIGGYYRERPSDWRRKDNYYYRASSEKRQKHSNHSSSSNSSNNKSYNLSTLKVNPFSKWAEQQRRPGSVYGYTPKARSAAGQYPWWNLATRLSNSLRRKPIPSRRIDSSGSRVPVERQRVQQQQRHSARQQQQQQQPAASGFYRHPAATARKHRVYPVFGKRSIADEPPTAPSLVEAMHNNDGKNNNNESSSSNSPNTNHTPTQQQQQATALRRHRRSGIVGPELSRMERIHVRHHRSTRQTLYEKIEKYLDKLDIKNSHQCILRALCETGQKSNERSPSTFVAEIMRAVFTMPEALDVDLLENRVIYKDQRYDRANGFAGSCAKEYALCQQSLWQTQFVK